MAKRVSGSPRMLGNAIPCSGFPNSRKPLSQNPCGSGPETDGAIERSFRAFPRAAVGVVKVVGPLRQVGLDHLMIGPSDLVSQQAESTATTSLVLYNPCAGRGMVFAPIAAGRRWFQTSVKPTCGSTPGVWFDQESRGCTAFAGRVRHSQS